ncbi:hypothetical protein BKA63DRAFT_510564 [Paraphoma chrysanthemicola]|nr:hypothetical protein BKA63DRAFT_510564 [Paraphoma chrysanthemicola]
MKNRRPMKELYELLEQHKKKRIAGELKRAEKNQKDEEAKAELKAIKQELHTWLNWDVQDFPLGYPRQAAFQSNRPSFAIYRSFDYLHARVILQIQDELRSMEDKLKQIDIEDSESGDSEREKRVTSREADQAQALPEEAEPEHNDGGPRTSTNGSPLTNSNGSVAVRKDKAAAPISDRAALLEQIRKKLLHYDEILVKTRELSEFKRPNDRDYINFRTWFFNEKPLSSEAEEDFIFRKGDLITLRPRAEWGEMDGWIEAKMIPKLPKVFRRYFDDMSKQSIENIDDFTTYYSVPRIENLTTAIIVFVIVMLLAVPVFIMYGLSWLEGKGWPFLNIGLLVGFSLVFAASMGRFTQAKRAELFAASAAYSAVLIVFIGNSVGQGQNKAVS